MVAKTGIRRHSEKKKMIRATMSNILRGLKIVQVKRYRNKTAKSYNIKCIVMTQDRPSQKEKKKKSLIARM